MNPRASKDTRLAKIAALAMRKNYSLARTRLLLQRALAPWPRRSAPLLLINCGDGALLPTIWNAGFEIAASEANAVLRGKAGRANLPGLEIYAARDDHLPFENDEFDWAILRCARETSPASFDEATRVARRGLMVVFWNASSLAALLAAPEPRVWRRDAKSWFFVWRQIRRLNAGETTYLSTLASPECAWREEARVINLFFDRLPLGAWCVVRVDFDAPRSVTPLALRVGHTPGSPASALEYSPKRLLTPQK